MSEVCVRVRVGEEHYALDVAHVVEVADLGAPTPVPGAGPAFLGVGNLHGQVVPFLDLAALLGAGRGALPARAVVVEDGVRRAGLAVDEVMSVGAAPEATEAPESSLLSGAALLDGTLVGIVDVPALLAVATEAAGS